ncbi:MAG: tetratricopeptide repeat protein [Acidobacteria bacterium]|nr:tetratricopeptide repeat protein [Acidobacteriota bacterium]
MTYRNFFRGAVSIGLSALLAAGAVFAAGTPGAPGTETRPPAAGPESEAGMSYYYFLRARDCVEENDPASAEKLFRKALALDPDSDTLVVELAIALLTQDRKPEAETLLGDMLKKHPRSIPVRKVLAGLSVNAIGGDYAATPESRAAWQKAVEAYNAILEIDPRDKESLFFLGRLYYAANLLDRAEEYLKRYLEVDRNSLDGALFLAQLYLSREKSAEALEVLKQAETTYPDVVQIRLLKARIQENTQKVDDAEKTYQDLIARNAFDPNAYLNYARILHERGLDARAVEVLDAAIANHVRNADILTLLGMACQKLNRHDRAIQAFQDAVEEESSNPENIYYLAVAYSMAGDSMTAARTLEPVLTKLDSDPSLFDIQNAGVFKRAVVSAMVTFNLEAGRDTEALSLLARLLNEYPESVDDDVYVRMAGVYRKRGETDKALETLAKGDKQFPGNLAIFNARGEALAAAGRLEEARKAVAERMEKADDKDKASLCFGLASALMEAKRWDEAIEVVNRGLAADPKRKALQFQQGAVLERAGKYKEAEAVLTAFLRENADNAVALNYLGYMLVDLDLNVAKGMEYIRKALELEPLNPAYLDSLGWGYFRLKEYPKALEYLLKAARGIEGDATVLDHVGDAYRALKDDHKAREFYEQALRIQRDPAEREKIEKKLRELRPRLVK